jgi:hypothetical protein
LGRDTDAILRLFEQRRSSARLPPYFLESAEITIAPCTPFSPHSRMIRIESGGG